MNKKILSLSIATLITCSISNNFVKNVNSSETPQLVYTDTWTTSYFIDDDVETLYPYIKCTANVFDDGTLRVSFANTHKWEDSDDEKHYVTIVGTYPFSTSSHEYGYTQEKKWEIPAKTFYPVNIEYEDTLDRKCYNGKLYDEKDCIYYSGKSKNLTSIPEPDFSFWKTVDLSYYPSAYDCNRTENVFKFNEYFGLEYISCAIDKYGTENELWANVLYTFTYDGKLSFLPIDKTQSLTFAPFMNWSKKGTYKFYLFGHDITITPEMLEGKVQTQPTTEPIVTTPPTTTEPTSIPNQSDTDKIKALEVENKKLKEELEKLKSRNVFDLNNDGVVNIADLITIVEHLKG